MSTEQIVVLLIAERDRLNRAIEMLSGTAKRRGRPPGRKSTPAPDGAAAQAASAVAPAPKKKRQLSAAARKRISEAQKKRWAAAKQ